MPNGDCRASPPPSRVRSTFSASLFGVAWQDAQPPMLNIVLPLSISRVCGGKAEAGTVAGMVSTQSSAQTRATAAAMSVSFRIAAPFLYSLPAAGRRGGGSSSALLETILFVAAAAIVLADIGKGRLEGVQVFDRGVGRLGVGAELGEPGFEVFQVLPDFRAGAEGIVRRRLIDRIF